MCQTWWFMWVSLDTNDFILAIPQHTHLLKNNVQHECHQFLFFKKHILTICIYIYKNYHQDMDTQGFIGKNCLETIKWQTNWLVFRGFTKQENKRLCFYLKIAVRLTRRRRLYNVHKKRVRGLFHPSAVVVCEEPVGSCRVQTLTRPLSLIIYV